MPFDGRISGFGSVSGVFFGSWRTKVLVSVRSEGFRPSRSVSTLAGMISSVSGVADLLSDTQCTFSTLLPRGFSSLSVGLDTLVPLPTLLLMVSTLSYPLTGFRPSFPRGISCLTLPLFQPFIPVVLSMTQTLFLHFRSYPFIPLPDARLGVLHSRPPL